MMRREIAGWFLLLLPFVALVIYLIVAAGVWSALIIIGAWIAFYACVKVGGWLLGGDR